MDTLSHHFRCLRPSTHWKASATWARASYMRTRSTLLICWPVSEHHTGLKKTSDLWCQCAPWIIVSYTFREWKAGPSTRQVELCCCEKFLGMCCCVSFVVSALNVCVFKPCWSRRSLHPLGQRAAPWRHWRSRSAWQKPPLSQCWSSPLCRPSSGHRSWACEHSGWVRERNRGQWNFFSQFPMQLQTKLQASKMRLQSNADLPKQHKTMWSLLVWNMI